MNKGIVFNVQKCSIHDGSGIRTLVFLKGCPLRCLWCANPESQNPYSELTCNEKKCIACKACIVACPKKCIVDTSYFDRDVCDNCGDCVDVCYAEAKKITGKEMLSDELIDIIAKDHTYYEHSGGGVTFSGGEPLQSPQFLYECVSKCKELGISAIVETCGYADYAQFSPIIDKLDMIFFDIKHADPKVHKVLTGVSNEKILENLKKINTHKIDIHVRIPIIPGYNDSMDNLKAIANLVAPLQNVKVVELIAYHKLGAYKYQAVGRKYTLEDVIPPSSETMLNYVNELNQILVKVGKKCHFEQ